MHTRREIIDLSDKPDRLAGHWPEDYSQKIS
jgi:hypothetical protein